MLGHFHGFRDPIIGKHLPYKLITIMIYLFRSYFFRIIKLIFFPGSLISFPEVLVADALTSISKIMKDLGVTFVVFFAHVIRGEDPVLYHDHAMVIIAVLASLPFA